MVPQPHLSVDVRSYLLNAVNIANPQLPEALDGSNVTLGVPTSMAQSTSAGINTSIALTPISDSGYTDAITIYYPRIDISQRLAEASISPSINLTTTPLTSWNDFIAALNHQYNLSLSSYDIPTTPFSIAYPAPSSLSMAINPASYLYTGTLAVALQGSQFPAANEAWADFDAGAIVFTAGTASATYQGQTITFTGLFDEAFLATAPFAFTVTQAPVIAGIPDGVKISAVSTSGLGPTSSLFTFSDGQESATSKYNGSHMTVLDHVNTVLGSGSGLDFTLGFAGASIVFEAGKQYAIVFDACVPEWKLTNNNWLTEQAAVRFQLYANGVTPNYPSYRAIARATQTTPPDGFVPVGYTGLYCPAALTTTQFDTAGPAQPLIDGVLFQSDNTTSDPPITGVPHRVLINFVDAPDLMPNTSPGSEAAAEAFPYAPSHVFDDRQAKIIDSRGTIYWQGRLGDVSESAKWQGGDGTFTSGFYMDPILQGREGALYDQLPSLLTTLALVIDAPSV